MSVEAMIVIDLHTTDYKKRMVFYESLIDSGWDKLPGIDTLWSASISDVLNNKGAELLIRSALKKASVASEIDYSSWYFIGKDYDVMRGYDGSGIYVFRPPVDTILGSDSD
ncbi:TPA: hypothetical protein ACMDTI_003994 [Vibrio parahaemolyticus]|uniref:hypothetical protein n=1 Tax=Vibrio parahaemolyticus TaxID=670 RepID=UPI000427EEF5|nr:hypothetical protein [Vibrio parahaemolyticus]